MTPIFVQTVILLLRELEKSIVQSCMKIGLSTKCQDCQFWCKEGVEVSHRAIFIYNQAMKDFSVGISLMETSF